MAVTPVPSTAMVVSAWISSIASAALGLDPTKVGPSLPTSEASWAAGFVQVTAVGGTPDPHLPLRRPVVRCSCWAARQGTTRSPFGLAESLASGLVAAAQDFAPSNLTLSPSGFGTVHLHTVIPAGEPVRVPDPTGAARVDLLLEAWWSR